MIARLIAITFFGQISERHQKARPVKGRACARVTTLLPTGLTPCSSISIREDRGHFPMPQVFINTLADIGAFRQNLLFSFQLCCSKMYFPMPFLRLSPTGNSLSACRQWYFFPSSHSLIYDYSLYKLFFNLSMKKSL